MKIVKKPLEVIAYFTKDNVPQPLKFRIENDDETWTTIKIDNIIHTEKQKFGGEPIYVFSCQSQINDTIKSYELRYVLSSCKWMLWKI